MFQVLTSGERCRFISLAGWWVELAPLIGELALQGLRVEMLVDDSQAGGNISGQTS